MRNTIATLLVAALMAFALSSCESEEESAPQGTVLIASLPEGASILLDGSATGRHTPGEVAVAPGTHSFGLRQDGYYGWDTTIIVQPGLQQLWHQLEPGYDVGPVGDPSLPDTVWFSGPYEEPERLQLVGNHQVWGRISNVIGEDVRVALLVREHVDSCCWSLVPQLDGQLTVPIVGTGWWQAEVPQEWWCGSVVAWVVPRDTVLDPGLRLTYFELLQNPTPTAAAFFPIESFEWGSSQAIVGFAGHNWWWYDPIGSTLRVAEDGAHFSLIDNSNDWWWGAAIQAYEPYPWPPLYSYGTYRAVVAGPLGGLPGTSTFSLAVRDLDWFGIHGGVVFGGAAGYGYFFWGEGGDTLGRTDFERTLPVDTTVTVELRRILTPWEPIITAKLWLGTAGEGAAWDSVLWRFPTLQTRATFYCALAGGWAAAPAEVVVTSFSFTPQ